MRQRGVPSMTGDVQVIATQPAPVASDARLVDQLRLAGELAPGADLVAALEPIDVARLDAEDRIQFLTLLQKAHNWLSGSMMLAVAAAAGPAVQGRAEHSPDAYSPTGDMREDLVCAELGAALNTTPGATAGLINRARAAVGPLRSINEQLLAGEWGETHLRRAVDATEDVEPGLAATAAANVCGRLRKPQRCSPTTLRNRLQRELAELSPQTVTERIKAKRRNRGAALHNDGDFRARLEIDGPWPALNWTFAQLADWAEKRLALLKEIRRAYPAVPLCCTDAINDAVAAFGVASDGSGAAGAPTCGIGKCRWCGATDDRLPTLAQLRADALFDAVRVWSARRDTASEGSAEPPQGCDLPRRGRRWRHAIVVCDLATALGLADNPGWVPGYGAVPAGLARELASQASHWRRFLLDDQQQLIDVGRHTYRPSDALREIVTARDQTCTFPGCTRPATDTDLDHRENFDGHNTTSENLHPLCRTHHRLKTHGGWQVTADSEGWYTWTSPRGRRYTHRVVPPWVDP